MPTNEQRAEIAFRTLLVFAQYIGEPMTTDRREQTITDLLTNLAHLCDEYGEDLQACFNTARKHYTEETDGTGEQFTAPRVPLSGAIGDFVRMAAAGDSEADDLQRLACALHPLGSIGINALCERLNVAPKTAPEPDPRQIETEALYRDTARENYGGGDPIKITSDAPVSVSDSGAYVTAEIWIPREEAGAGLIPHDPKDDEPDEDPETIGCSEPGCSSIVHSEDPYFATPCGTYCSEHMGEHVKGCEICRSEFPETDATE